MPDSNLPVFPNPPQPYFGQGVRNMPQPPDPYDKAEKSTLGTSAPPSLLPIEETKPVISPPPPPPPLAPISVPVPAPNPPAGGPPPSPNVPYKDYPLDYKFPKKRRLSPWLLVIPVVLILLGLTIYGIIYFLNRPQPQPTTNDNASLILKDDSSQNLVSSLPVLPNVPTKTIIPAENGFGTLPPPSFEFFTLNGLSLGGVIVANESTASANIPQKSDVIALDDTNLASTSAFFSPEHSIISKPVLQLTPNQFYSPTSQHSLYPLIKPGVALTTLITSPKLFGVAEKKTDWTRNKLKSLEIKDYYIAFYYPAGSKYWYPIYVFEGNGKLVGEAANSSGFKMIFFLPAIAN